MEPIDQIEFRIAYIASCILQGTADRSQQLEFEDWLAADPNNRLWFKSLQEPQNLTQKLEQLKQYDVEKALKKVKQRIPRRTRRPFGWSFGIAASLVLVLLVSLLKMNQPKLSKEDAPPGFNQAILTLSDGQIILLDSNQARIVVEKEGIRYVDRETIIPSQGLTIQTPRGGTYQVTLPDGTEVWLNAATKLQYPANFGHSERFVDLEGEAYFEVASHGKANQKIPFNVRTSDYTVQVLGTHFNIHAYPENRVQTTLLEGSVKLKSLNNDLETILNPGETAVLTPDSFVTKKTDPLAAIGWKNGVFIFQETSLKDLLQELSRWYQVDIDKNTRMRLPEKRFNGDLPRNVTLAEALRLIRMTSGIQITLKEGRLVLIE